MPRIIDFETHIQANEFIEEISKYKGYPNYTHDSQGRLVLRITPKISEVRQLVRSKSGSPETRIKEMDEAGVDKQVISSSNPSPESFPARLGVKLAKILNNQISDWLGKYPDRFIGLASLPIQDARSALIEFDRAKDLGMKGLVVFSNARGMFIDEKKFWPVYEMAEKTGFPIFLHPAYPVNIELYAKYNLFGAPLGYGVDGATAAVRLIMSGVFERFPNLNVVLPHLGEAIPFFLNRIDIGYNHDPDKMPQLSKKPSEYFLKNFCVDTSGVHSSASLMCAYQVLKHDNILFGSDYPFGRISEEINLVSNAKIPDEDKEKIFWKNSERLFGIKT